MQLSHLLGDPRVQQAPLQGEYELGKTLLGTGLSGSVAVAVHRRSGATYAVKILTKYAASRQALQDFMTEVELHLAFDHPLIPRLERVYETEAFIYLVMEHLKGGDMFDHVQQRGHIAEEESAKALHQMATAIAYLHDMGTAHLDVKLENFAFQSESRECLKLIDFGHSGKCDKGYFTRLRGTPHMMAPEVLDRKYNASADIWALGVVAHVMMCGYAPWAQSAFETRRMIREGQPMYRDEFFKLSPAAQNFIRSLLNPDPAERPSAKDVLNHGWLAPAVPASLSTSYTDEEKSELVKPSDCESATSPGVRV